MEEKVYYTKVAKVWRREDGIAVQKYNEGVVAEASDIEEIVELGNKYFKEENLILVDISNAKSISYEARQYMKTNEASANVKAVALKVKSNVSKIIGNFFVSVSNLDYPTKLFTSEEDAIEWLKSFK